MNPDSKSEKDSEPVAKREGKDVKKKTRGVKAMELAIAGVIAISVILWILSGVAQYKHHETAVIWTVYFAISCTVLVFFLNWQKTVWARPDTLNSTENLATGNQERKRPAFHEKSEWFTVQFGTDTARNKIADLEKAPFTPMVFGKFDEIVPLRIYAEDGLVFADVTLFQGRDKPTVIIKHSEYDKNLPVGWDLNSKDGEALEIVNENGIPVFQLIYKSATSIEVQGVFYTGSGFFVADHSGIKAGIPGETIPRALKPIFKYPSWQHRGELASATTQDNPAMKDNEKPKTTNTTISRSIVNSPGASGNVLGDVSIHHHAPPTRLVTVAQANKMIAVLQPHSGSTLAIVWLSNNNESFTYADQIARVFQSAGWKVEALGAFSGTAIGVGVVCEGKFPIAEASAVVAAFREAELQITERTVPGWPEGKWRLVVGESRSPASSQSQIA